MDEELTSGGGAALSLSHTENLLLQLNCLGTSRQVEQREKCLLGEPLGDEQRGPRGLKN